MPVRYKVYDNAYPHFITCTVVYGIPAFCREAYLRLLADSFNYCIAHKNLLVHGFVVMHNHFHAICTQSRGHLADTLRDLKRHTASKMLINLEEAGYHTWIRALRHAGDGEARLWDPSFHPVEVHSEKFFEQKLEYIHANPVRAGFVELPQHWKYSSAGFYYCGTEPLIPITLLEW